MSRIGALVLGILVGAVGVYGSLHYHVLRTDTGYEFVPKNATTFTDTYVDTRQFGIGDWMEHKELMQAVVTAKKEHLFKDSTIGSLKDGLNDMIDGFRQSDNEVAAFRFGAVADSYAAKTSGDRNVGVIGFAIYAEEGATWTPAELQRRDTADPFPARNYARPPG